MASLAVHLGAIPLKQVAGRPANTCWQGEPLILTSYVGVFPLFIIGVIAAEMHLQRYPVELLFPAIGVAALHLVVKRLQTGPDEVPEEMEGYETEFQLLGLSS